MRLESYDLIIASSNIKKRLLRRVSLDKKFIKAKIMTLSELIDNLFGKIKTSSYKELMNHFNVSFDTAKTYLENAYFIPKIKEFLDTNNLISYNPYFKSKYKSILFINTPVDKYILDELKDFKIDYYSYSSKNKQANIYEFDTLEAELEYIAGRIFDLLETTPIDKIHLVNVTEEMVIPLKRIFTIMGLPICLNEEIYVIKLSMVQNFLSSLSDHSILESLDLITDSMVKNSVIDLINQYQITDLDYSLLKHLLSKKRINYVTYKNTISCINLEDVLEDDDYYFILGCNEGILPRVVKDEDYFSDEEKNELGILNTEKINEFNINLFTNVLALPNVVLAYHLRTNLDEYKPSHVILDNNYEVVKNESINANYSSKINILNYARYLDKLYKYNEYNEVLPSYYATYKQEKYKDYSNEYTGIDNKKLVEYLKNGLTLSYSSLDNYFHCAFKFYLKNILKVDAKEESLALTIGSVFHDCLSKIYEPDFDLEKAYKEAINKYQLPSNESFFINKLKKDLDFVIKTIRKQDSLSKLSKVKTEQEVYINFDGNVKVVFKGIIDKVKYQDVDDKITIAIIDYKTGSIETNLDNIGYGFHLQLPIYIYLAKNKYPNANIAGFYLQKILNKSKVDTDETDDEKNLKLAGYTNADIEIASSLDSSYEQSMMISGLKRTNNGWYAKAKVLTSNDIDLLVKKTESLVFEAKDNILAGKYPINPKRIDDKLEGCRYCKYKDVCFMKEEDIVNLTKQSFLDALGGEEHD